MSMISRGFDIRLTDNSSKPKPTAYCGSESTNNLAASINRGVRFTRDLQCDAKTHQRFLRSSCPQQPRA